MTVTVSLYGVMGKLIIDLPNVVSDLNFSDAENDALLPKSKSKKKRTRYEEKAERIEDTVDQLKEKHGNQYTLVQ